MTYVKKVFFDVMDNRLFLNFKSKFLNTSMDRKGYLYNVDKITDFLLSFISNTKHFFNREMLTTLSDRQIL